MMLARKEQRASRSPSVVSLEDSIVVRVRDYTKTPGGRTQSDGDSPGEEFREEFLAPAFRRAQAQNKLLVVDLDGTAGYASSFLEEAFGGLARAFSVDAVAERVRVLSQDEPYLESDVATYISEANDPR